jgi:hypothetical protein
MLLDGSRLRHRGSNKFHVVPTRLDRRVHLALSNGSWCRKSAVSRSAILAGNDAAPSLPFKVNRKVGRSIVPSFVRAFSRKQLVEHIAPIAIIFCYLLLAFHIVLKGGYAAQDFGTHVGLTFNILSGVRPWNLASSLSEIPLTNPPLLYLIGAALTKLLGDPEGGAASAGLLTVCNAGSLYVLWRLVRPVLSDTWSLWLLAFLATLPAYVITSLAYAPDALTILPFLAYCALNMKLLQAPIPSKKTLAASCLVQIVGGLSKFTFIALGPVSLFVAWLLATRSLAGRGRKLGIVFLVFVVPFAANSTVFKWYSGSSPHFITFPRLAHRITLRSFLPYSRDIDIFRAPGYFDPILENGTQIPVDRFGNRDDSHPDHLGYRILVDNRYSYPALLHLGLYTDIMNVAGRFQSPANARSAQNQFFQEAGVILGVIFSLAVLIANPCFVFVAASGLIKAFRHGIRIPNAGLFLIAAWLPAACWYLLIVGLFPFVANDVYWGGYWLPRLVIAPLVVFGVIGFWGLETLSGLLPVARVLQVVIAAQILFQAGLLFVQ